LTVASQQTHAPASPVNEHGGHVLLVESYPQVVAGQQRTLSSLLDHWPDEAPAPVIVTPAEGPFTQWQRERGHSVAVWPQPELLGRYGGALYRDRGGTRLRTVMQSMRYIAAIRRGLKRLRPRVVFCNDMRGILTFGPAARSLGIPVVTWDKLDRPHGWLDSLQLPLVTRNICISEAVKAKYPNWQRKWYRRRMTVCTNGADLHRFDAAHPDRTGYGFDNHEVVFAIVGSITHRKGQDQVLDLLPDLLESIPEARLVIVGSGEDTEADKRYAASLLNKDHPQVWFTGQRDDIPTLMRSIDVLIAPSRHEGMGQVVAEAMACRKPVVGTMTGGIAEIVVHGETGYLFDPEHPSQLLDQLTQLGRDSALRQQMGEAGRRRAELHYDRDRQMHQVASILSQEATGRHRIKSNQ